MRTRRRTAPLRLAAPAAVVSGALIATAGLPLTSSAAPSVGQLNSALGQQQARQQGLAASVSGLSQAMGALGSQIALVQSREASVRGDLGRDRVALVRIQALLTGEQQLVSVLRARLAHARMLLARQVVSRYESDRPDLVGVVLEARGFTDLLERLNFLRRAEQQQQRVIKLTRAAKAHADSAQRRLANLQATDLQVTSAATVRARALAAMNALLQSKQAALGQARAAQQAALQASRARGQQLQSAIAQLQAERAAAQPAAANASRPPASGSNSGTSSSSGGGGSGTGSGPASSSRGPDLSPSGGWAIPSPIVMCESGGQNVPPNGSGASGYYQIEASTWKQYGGSGPAAYLASKSEQDAVASRIWNGGAGASNWVCAGTVGIH